VSWRTSTVRRLSNHWLVLRRSRAGTEPSPLAGGQDRALPRLGGQPPVGLWLVSRERYGLWALGLDAAEVAEAPSTIGTSVRLDERTCGGIPASTTHDDQKLARSSPCATSGSGRRDPKGLDRPKHSTGKPRKTFVIARRTYANSSSSASKLDLRHDPVTSQLRGTGQIRPCVTFTRALLPNIRTPSPRSFCLQPPNANLTGLARHLAEKLLGRRCCTGQNPGDRPWSP